MAAPPVALGSGAIVCTPAAIAGANDDRAPSNQQNNEECSADSAFFNPEFFNFLVKSRVLVDNALAVDCSLPPSSSTQKEAFISLIDQPFELRDNRDNQIVATNLSIKKILDFLFGTALFKKANILTRMQLAGGGVTQVIESDMKWVADFMSSVLGEAAFKSHSKHIKAFPPRNLPDIDIHLICKPGSGDVRRQLVNLILDELGRIVTLENRAYLESEIQKVKSLDQSAIDKDKDINAIFEAIDRYDTAKKEKADDALLSILFNAIAVAIIKKNCLKKISNNAFGTILSFGALELIFTERTDHLLTPDKFVIVFNSTQASSVCLTFLPEGKCGAECIVHRAAKTACIDLEPTVHTFMKVCAYMSFGYHVPRDDKFDEAFAKFIRNVYSKTSRKLSEEGKLYFARFGNNHFKENPAEGICIIFTLFRLLQEKKRSIVIPLIIQQLNPFLRIPTNDPFLNALRKLLIAFPGNFETIANCLQMMPGATKRNSINESWIYFRGAHGYAPYVLRQTHNPNAYDLLDTGDYSRKVDEILPALLWADAMEFEVSDVLKRLKISEQSNAAYYLLVRCKGSFFRSSLLVHFPRVYLSLSAELRLDLTKNIKAKFAEFVPSLIIDPFLAQIQSQDVQQANIAWIHCLISAGEYEAAVLLWEKCNLESNLTETKEIAGLLLSNATSLAVKIIQRCFSQASAESTKQLQEAGNAFVIKTYSKGPIVDKELFVAIQHLSLWLIHCYLERQHTEQAKKLFAYDNGSILPLLENSSMPYWELLSLEDCVSHVVDLSRRGNLPRASDGLDYLRSKPLSPDQILRLLDTFFALKEKFEQDQPTNIFTLNHYVYFLQNDGSFAGQDRLDRIAYLFKFLRAFSGFHRSCKTMLYFSPLKNIIRNFLEIPLQDYLAKNIMIQDLVAEIVLLIKDRNRPFYDFKQSFSQFLSQLIRHLKTSQGDQLILEIFKAIDSNKLPVDDCQEIAECRYLVHTQHALRNHDFQKFFESLKDVDKDASSLEIMKHLDRLLSAESFEQLSLFLTALRAFKPGYDLTAIGDRILEKLRSLNKPETANKCVELFTIAQEGSIHLHQESQYMQFTLDLIKSLDPQQHWDFLYSLLRSRPQLQQLILPILFANLTTKNISSIEDYWIQEIERETYGGLDKQKARSCCEYFVAALVKARSALLIALIQHLEKIDTLFKSTNTEQENCFFYGSWLKYLFTAELHRLTFNEINLFNKLWAKVYSYPDEVLNMKLSEEIFWNALKSYSASDFFRNNIEAWKMLSADLHRFEPTEFEGVKVCVSHLLEKTAQWRRREVTKEIQNCIINLSRQCRTPSATNPPIISTLSKIPPFAWMKALQSIGTEDALIEALPWLARYMAQLKANKKTLKGPGRELFCGILEEVLDGYCTTKKVKRACLLIFEELDKSAIEMTKLWTKFTDILLNCFYEKPIAGTSAFNSSFLLEFWEAASEKCPGGMKIVLQDDKFIQSLVVLHENDETALAISLWNKLYMTVFTDGQRREMSVMYYQDEQGKKVNENSLEGCGLQFPDYTSMSYARKKSYATGMVITIRTISEIIEKDKISLDKRAYLFDLVFNCLCDLLEMNLKNKGLTSYKDIRASFLSFLDLVDSKDAPALNVHLTSTLPPILSKILRCKIYFHRESIFYEGFVMAGCPEDCRQLIESETDPSKGKKYVVDRQMINLAVEKFHAECLAPDRVDDFTAKIFFIALVGKVIERRLLIDYRQMIQFYKYCEEVLRQTNFSLHKAKKTVSVIEDCDKEYILLLTSREPQPEEARKEFYSTICDSYFKIINLPNLSIELRDSMFNRNIDWLTEYQSTFSDFDEKYRDNLHEYLNVFNTLLPQKSQIPELRTMLDRFLLFITPCVFKLSQQGKERRANLLHNWYLHLVNVNTTQSLFLYRACLKLAIQKGVYEGLNEIQIKAENLKKTG